MSEYICVDASFVVRFLTSPPTETVYREYWQRWQENQKEIIAPTLLYYELTNALYRLKQAEILTEDEAQIALEDALKLDIHLKGEITLHLQAVTLARRFELPATYDAHYLAVAEQFQAEFFTGDKRLFYRVQSQFPKIYLIT
ncbi:MAG: type II toxin-antitoxin system VapC family toxin [Jaaginema sp. PMC 1078.18]|nr:type II toxin-antitoxin system VapC family toxin [Jaaginema sp. PMC 1078.18]